ncbi:MAG: Rrf2 family transcriptional regulator [Armatimonadetes bacterium]|nr:Rrf2 family transcriptional regulator [Armatimonadota bacterium]
MPLFSSRISYALRAVVDLAMQPQSEACQSRDIAKRQNIPGPYLDQILSVLNRAGIVTSIRAAAGGYHLSRAPRFMTVGSIVRTLVGDRIFTSGDEQTPDPGSGGADYVVWRFEEKLEATLSKLLNETTIEELVNEKHRLNDALSIMPGI